MMKKLHAFLLTGTPTGTFASLGLLLMRLLFGLTLAINHGWPTIRGLVQGASDYPDPLGLGPVTTMVLMGSSEFFCALFVVVGLLTRVALVPLVFGFCVAVFVYHAGDPFGNIERAFLYLSAMSVLLITGPGRFSLDALFFKTEKDLA